jgi:hypothetical protein
MSSRGEQDNRVQYRHGIELAGNASGVTGTARNLVVNNYIGLDRRGRRLPNTGRPIVNDGSQNTIRGNRT